MIAHPTGSEEFSRELSMLGAPVPWRLCDEEVGEILADDGAIICRVSEDGRTDEAASALAMWIVMAINTLAGFQAVPATETKGAT